ncbi:ATP-binding protein [Actinomadura rugatobispora]|uniref:ATP-binding protein n=1 Tax=Actinomadura rugatobispora TaxID=1994 RepID=A0ABW0ZQ88_9ACTN|nr:hypothetical protein GCM10010200_024420 [Actinomadura rugatobispora]
MTRRHLGTCVVPSAAAHVAIGRRWLRGTIESLPGFGDGAGDDAVLLLSEALTNAIVHGGGEVVEVDAFFEDGALRVEVVDGGGGGVPRFSEEPCGEGGRGLPIMEAVARKWGYEAADGGRLRVWFEITFL